MDVLALEAKNVNASEPDKKSGPRPKPKPPKKAKRIVYFEVEILDGKTKEKLLLLDKVSFSLTDYTLTTMTIKTENLHQLVRLYAVTPYSGSFKKKHNLLKNSIAVKISYHSLSPLIGFLTLNCLLKLGK